MSERIEDEIQLVLLDSNSSIGDAELDLAHSVLDLNQSTSQSDLTLRGELKHRNKSRNVSARRYFDDDRRGEEEKTEP